MGIGTQASDCILFIELHSVNLSGVLSQESSFVFHEESFLVFINSAWYNPFNISGSVESCYETDRASNRI